MEKELRLYKYVDGIADTPFPSLEEQAVLRTFTYSAKRMGGAPSIAGTIMHESCLDSLWSNKVYATFNGEKYFVRRTPSSSHSNTDSRYRHDVELISERASLDEVYFFDVVTVDSESDKPQSNNSNVVFFGDIFEFVSRLNKSLTRSGLGYNVQVDAGVTSEAKLVTLKDQFVTNALQEIPKLYNLKYYFDGKTIHVGDSSLELVDTFQYGSTSALLSINKNNSNSRIVNRCSGLGGSKNIPYFYPNKSPYGDVAILLNGSSTDRATVFSWERFAKCGLSKTIVYKEVVQGGTVIKTYTRDDETHTITHGENDWHNEIYTKWRSIPIDVNVYKGTLTGRFTKIKAVEYNDNEHSIAIRQNGSDFYTFSSVGTNPWSVDLSYGKYELVLKIPYDYGKWDSFDEATKFEATLTETIENVRGWFVDGNEMVGDLSSLGITFIGTPANGDTIRFELKHDRIPVSANLMPYIYRESMGEERFYNAVDGEIKVGDEVIGDYKFSNPYFEGDPREHIESFDDIYPTIEGITNASGQRVDEFVEFAYDENDSDERDENNNLAHPYFYAKLRKFDGENGFNLFTHAIESEAMSLSVKDGSCGGCEWKIQVDENTNLNPVQVWECDQYDENGVLQRKGTLKRDANGNVLRGAPQEMQNDTTKNEVWVALHKDESTFGVSMPNAKNNYKPSIGDKFVILNISLPQSYIEIAEKKLSKAVVDYMGKNNSERFNFGIKFSRIYLEENKDNILQKLSENIRLRVSYDDRVIPLYASGFTYKMDASSPLPEVTVELEDNVSVLNDRLSVIVRPLYMQAIENAQKEVVSKVLSEPSFASTIKPNIFANDATFNKNVRMDGVVSSSDYIEGLLGGQGWGIYKSLDGNTVFEVDEVVARKGFKTVEFVVNETKAQKGEYLITLGNCKVSHVDEYDTYYRCYYETHGNTDVSGFVVNDQAICRVYDESYANVNKYYWRLVVGVGFDYVDLSKLDFDGEGIPAQNDVLVQLGNREDVARQNAITITSAPTPSIIQYKGLSGYSITQDNIVTKISPEENILTGKVTMQSGSKGLENFDEWAEKQAQIDGFEYLREAMANDTTIEGGLIQSSLLRLGYKQNGEFVAMSGTSGLYDSDDAHGGIAAWYGGDMIDAENDPNSNRAAQALFRMDGTGYLAGGKITWDKNGSGSVAGGSLKWDKDGYITLANEIYLGDDEEETLGSILNKVSGIGSSLSDMFTVVESGGSKYIRANYDFFSIGGITAGGIGSSSGGGTGGGGSSTLSGLNDVALKSPISSDVLVYNGSHWVNTPMSSIKPDLTAYATKSWVEDKGYALNTALLKVDARLANVETIFEADQDGAINKWSEVVAFLDGIEGDTLDNILSQFATQKWVEGNYLPIDGTAKNAEKLGGEEPDHYATAAALSTLSKAVTEFRTLFDSFFEKDTANNAIKAKLSLYSLGGITAGGIGSSSGGSGGGGSTTLAGLNDVSLTSAIANDMLVYNGTHWVNTPMSSVKPDLSGYATKDSLSGYLPINGTAPSSNTLQWANFTEASSIGFNFNQWFALGKISDIPSMGYSTVFQAGLNMSRAWQIWVSRVDNATHTRHTDGTNWTEEYTLLDDHNYSNYTVPKTGGTFSGNVTAPTFIGDLQGLAEAATVSRGLARKTNEITTQEEFDSFLFGDRLAFTQFRGGSSYGGWDTSGVRGGDGMLISVPWSNTNYGAQLAFDDERPYMALRAKSNGTWSEWQQFAFKSDIPTNYLQKSNADWYGILFNSTSEGGGVRMVLQNTGVLKSGFGSNNDSTYIVDYVSGSNIHLSTKLEFEYDGKRNEVLHGGNYTNFNVRKLQTLRADGNYWYPDNYLLYGQWATDNGSILDWKVDGYAVRVDIAKNAEKLGNQAPAYYATATALTTLSDAVTEFRTLFDSLFEKDTANNAIKAKLSLYSLGGITAGGIGSGGSSGGGGASYNRLDAWADYTNDKSGWVLSALLGKDLDTRVSALANAGYITASALDPYAKTTDVANTYATQTALQGVDIRVQAIEYIFEKDQDGVINKWSEIVDFLAGVEGDTLDSILEQFATKTELSSYLPKTGGTLTGNLTAPTFIGNLTGNATNALALKGIPAGYANSGAWIPIVESSGVMEIGKYIDFHTLDEGDGVDYSLRIECQGAYRNRVYFPTTTGTLALTSDIPTKLSQLTDDVVSGKYLKINGTAPSSNSLQWSNFTVASGIGFNFNQWFAMGRVSDIPSMGYSTVFQAGLNMSRAWQIWVSRTDHATHTRHTDGTNWTEEYTLLDDHNYTDYTVPKTGGTFNGRLYVQTSDSNGFANEMNGKGSYLIHVPNVASTSSWARGLSLYDDATSTTRELIGSFGTSEGHKYDYLGGTYDNYILQLRLSDKFSTFYGDVKTNGKFIGNLQGNADSATSVNWTGVTNKDRVFDYLGVNVDANQYGGGSNVNGIIYINSSANDNPVTSPKPYEYGAIIQFGAGESNSQFFAGSENLLFWRNRWWTSGWSDWKTIAFTDSNVASATKLQTPRTLWGQSFDGTGNIIGRMASHQSGIPSMTTIDNVVGSEKLWLNNYNAKFSSGNNAIVIAVSGVENERSAMIQSGHGIEAYAQHLGRLLLNPLGGNVGVNTNDPKAPLHVNGKLRIGDAILEWDSTNKCITIKNANTGEKASLFVDGGVTATAIN